MDKKALLWFLGGIVAGIVLQPQISKLPLVSKIPTA